MFKPRDSVLSFTCIAGDSAGLPSRARVEQRLKRGGLYCAIQGYTKWQRFAVTVAARPRPVLLGLVWLAVWVMVSASLLALQTGTLYEFFNYLPFDVLAPVGLVSCVIVGVVVSERGGSRAALYLWLRRGLLLAVGLAAAPYLVFGIAHLDSRLAALTGAPHAVVAARLSYLPHIVVMLTVAAVLAIEVTTGLFTKLAGLARSSVVSAPGTVRDVLQTLPLVLTVLFFVAFSADSWRTFGLMSFAQLMVLTGLLIVCATIVILHTSAEDVRELMSSDRPAGNVSKADIAADGDLAALKAAGVTPRKLETEHDLTTEVKVQWMFQIALRVFFAGIFVALVIWLATALTMPPARLQGFLEHKPTQVANLHIGSLRLYLSREGLSVAAVLGAFASLVFVGVAISDEDKRTALFAPERERLRRLLELAGTYQQAVKNKVWRTSGGPRWPTYAAFLADDPARWRTEPKRLGIAWTDGSSRRLGGNRWEAAWNDTTRELYVYRSTKLGEVIVLSSGEDWSKVSARIEGWQAHERLPGSLDWLQTHLADQIPDGVAVAV